MKKILLGITLTGLTLNSFAAHNEDDIKKALTTDLDKCFIAAHQKYEGHIISLEREVEDGKPVYEFDIKTKDGKRVEIECNPLTGELSDEEFEVKKNDKDFKKAV
ncbi:MAG: PepSY domain-containing protein, partial [Methylophilaceae bacterium]